MKRTIRQLNREAGEWMVYTWLKGCECILASGRTPAKLSDYSKDDARRNLIPDHFFALADKENKRWFVSDRNWPKIQAHALDHAKQVLLHLGKERYPLSLAHFTTPVTFIGTKS